MPRINKKALMHDIDDENAEYVYVSQGTHAMYLNLNLHQW